MLLLALLAAAADPCESTRQQDLNRCAVERAGRADAALAVELRALEAWAIGNRVTGDVGPGAATSDRAGYGRVLAASQRAWLAYRDAQCRLAVYPDHGGSIAPMVQFGCLADLTEARIATLRALRY